jgi:hypothetical protein
MGWTDERFTRQHTTEIQADAEKERLAQLALGTHVSRPGALKIALAELLIRFATRLEYGPPARKIYLTGQGRGYGWSR